MEGDGQGGGSMSDAQAVLATLAAICVAVAVLAGWREHRRRGRADPDGVGVVDWTMVQFAAFVALAVIGLLAMKG
jgi:hypothetical protein